MTTSHRAHQSRDHSLPLRSIDRTGALRPTHLSSEPHLGTLRQATPRRDSVHRMDGKARGCSASKSHPRPSPLGPRLVVRLQPATCSLVWDLPTLAYCPPSWCHLTRLISRAAFCVGCISLVIPHSIVDSNITISCALKRFSCLLIIYHS